MVGVIHRRNDGPSPKRKRNKLIVRLKLRPSILAQFPQPSTRPAPKPLIKEHNTHQLHFLDELITEQYTELDRLSQERTDTMANIANYERVCNIHLDTLHRNLADACDMGIKSSIVNESDGEKVRLLKEEIETMRVGVQNWSRILMEAKQDAASKKQQITMIAGNVKNLEEERRQLGQWT